MHVVLVESHLAGHRPTYLYVYSRILLELGHRVSIVCAEEAQCRGFLVGEKGLASITIYPMGAGLNERSLFSSFDFYPKYLLWKRLKVALATMGTIDFIYFMYFDDFIFDFSERWLRNQRISRMFSRFLNKIYLPRFVNRCVAVPWSGILVHPEFSKWKEYRYFFKAPSNASICLLDETYEFPFEVKRRFNIPDITDEVDSPTKNSLADAVLEKAKGRKVISLLGSLEKRKGILPLIDVIKNVDPEKYFFLIAGKLDVTFASYELRRLSDLKVNQENSYCIYDGIPSENDFNSLVEISDIIYLVYIDFFHSSNLLTKASLFKKPVLVSQGTCMGKRVELFHTGIVVPECNAKVILHAIDNFDTLFDVSKAAYSTYFSLHSIAHLKESLMLILNPNRT
jgi:hypothetical protein